MYFNIDLKSGGVGKEDCWHNDARFLFLLLTRLKLLSSIQITIFACSNVRLFVTGCLAHGGQISPYHDGRAAVEHFAKRDWVLDGEVSVDAHDCDGKHARAHGDTCKQR